jgi:hypothetical protein
MQRPRLTLDATLRFLSLLNFKAPRSLIAEKFEVRRNQTIHILKSNSFFLFERKVIFENDKIFLIFSVKLTFIEYFQHIDTNENGFLELDEFIRLFRILDKRSEIKELFTKYSRGSRWMTPSQFLNFLQVEQRDTLINTDNVTNIILQFSQNVITKKFHSLLILSFFYFSSSLYLSVIVS